MGTVTKGKGLRGDLNQYDGTLSKSRTSSSGGTTTGLAVNDYVDVLEVFGQGSTGNMTNATIKTATGALGTQNVALMFAPGTWVISDTITLASNFSVICPAGCVFQVASGKTMTVQGVFLRQHATYSSGSGTFTISGTDLLGTTSTVTHYAADTGAADAYVIDVADNPASYVAGQMYAFLATNANTGASTVNVDSLGTKNIKKYDNDGTLNALESGDILANQIIRIAYDGTQFQLIPNKQLPAGVVTTSTDNVYTKTETWKKGADVASATNLLIDIDGNEFDITGTTTIATLATKGIGTIVILHFDGILQLTHSAADLVNIGGASITTAAGDIAMFMEYATADWRMINYAKYAAVIAYNPAAVAITGGSITGITDLTVPNGGTGVSTLTDGGVLLGSGTSPITAMGVLAANTFIVGDGTTNPTTITLTDEDDMVSDSNTAICSQQSIKAYADAVIPSGTAMLFYQNAAPTGWTIDATNNDKAIRIVSSAGGVAGGTTAFSSVMTGTTTGAHTLLTSQIPAHTHKYGNSSESIGAASGTAIKDAEDVNFSFTTSSTGGGGSHTHTQDLRIQY